MEDRYPLGYFLFASDRQNNFIPFNKNRKPDFSFDWENCRVESVNDSIIKVVLKNFHYYPNEIQINNVGVILKREKGVVADGIFFDHIGLFVEIIDDRRDGIIYIIGFKKVKFIPKRGVNFGDKKYITFQNIDISSVPNS